MMKIRYEFEIDACQTFDLDPRDFRDCDDIEELHMDLLEQPDPGWRASIKPEDLEAFWQAVQQAKEAPPLGAAGFISTLTRRFRLFGRVW